MQNEQTLPDELMDVAQTCRFFGGATRPINPATLYRNIKIGIFPKPVKISPNVNRWRRSECEHALAVRIAARDGQGAAA